MPVNVREADRDQLLLMPPSVADWLPEGHLAWFILDAVKELDLTAFYASYRADGRGGAAYSPESTLAVLLYGYCTGERSSRRIERRCIEDVAYRVLAANQHPDHATFARFRRRHEQAIGDLFVQVLSLCVNAGLVDTGLIAIDGTKMEADASYFANRSRKQLVEEILAEAERTDAEEDERFGDRRGDELPGEWATRSGRRERIRQALAQIEAQGPKDYEAKMEAREAMEKQLGRKLPGRKPSRSSGRSKNPRTANVTDPDSRIMLASGSKTLQGYNAQAATTPEQIVVGAEVTNAASDSSNFGPITDSMAESLERTGAAPVGTLVADAGYWSTENATSKAAPKVLIVPINRKNYYGGQRPVTEDQRRVITQIRDGELTRRQGAELLGISYNWMVELAAHYATDPDPSGAVVPPDQRQTVIEKIASGELSIREAARQLGLSYPKVGQLLALHRKGLIDPAVVQQQMEVELEKPEAKACFAKRKTIEPVFGNIKRNLGYRRFVRRGLPAVNSEWRFICAVHNLLKLRKLSIAG
jgi:transposase